MSMFIVLLILMADKNAIQDDYIENDGSRLIMLHLHNRKNISKPTKVSNDWKYEIPGLKGIETGRS